MDLLFRVRRVRNLQNGRFHPATVTQTTWHPCRRHQVCEALYQCSSRSLASRPNNRHRNCCFFLFKISRLLCLSFIILPCHENKTSPLYVLAPTDIFSRNARLNLRSRWRSNFIPINLHAASYTYFVKAKFVISFDHFAFLPFSLARSKLAQVTLLKT